MDRLNLLSQRVDEIAARGKLPDKAIERLAGQIAADRRQARPGAGHDRHRPHLPAASSSGSTCCPTCSTAARATRIEHGQAVFRDLERRLDEVAARLDERELDASLDSAGIMNEPSMRASTATRRTSAGDAARRASAEPDSDPICLGIEARLEDISARLESSSAQVTGVDPDIIRNLESQVVRTVAASFAAERAAARIRGHRAAPRRHRDARSPATASRSWRPHGKLPRAPSARSPVRNPTPPPCRRLPTICRSLDELTRRSDERNTKTFEAIHDTLLKIVDRLGSLEEPPSRRPSPSWRITGRMAAPPRKMAMRDAPSIEPDDDSAACAPAHAGAPQPSANARRRPVKRSPAEAAAEAAVAALDSDEGAAEPPARSPLDVRRPFARLRRQEGTRRAGDGASAVAARHGSASADARSRPAARSQARQPSARARLRHARPQRDHAAGARRTRRSRPRAARPMPPSPTSSPPRGAPRRRPPPKPRS